MTVIVLDHMSPVETDRVPRKFDTRTISAIQLLLHPQNLTPQKIPTIMVHEELISG